jgi:hypothetical protein
MVRLIHASLNFLDGGQLRGKLNGIIGLILFSFQKAETKFDPHLSFPGEGTLKVASLSTK